MTNRGMEYYSALQGRTLDLFNSSDESQKKKNMLCEKHCKTQRIGTLRFPLFEVRNQTKLMYSHTL